MTLTLSVLGGVVGIVTNSTSSDSRPGTKAPLTSVCSGNPVSNTARGPNRARRGRSEESFGVHVRFRARPLSSLVSAEGQDGRGPASAITGSVNDLSGLVVKK